MAVSDDAISSSDNEASDEEMMETSLNESESQKSKKKSSILHSIDPGDQVFIFECPMGIPLSGFKHQQIPGMIETGKCVLINEDNKESYQLTLTPCTSKKQQFAVLQPSNDVLDVPISGTVHIERIMKLKKDKLPLERNDTVPYPADLKRRHPMLGVDWRFRMKGRLGKMRKGSSKSKKRKISVLSEPESLSAK